MENAVDALKIAFAIFIFVIAIALSFSIVGQVRATSEVILALNDKANSYDYVANEDNNANNKERIVSFETILPTIYRYAKEQYAVTIINKDGTPIVRYDLYTEGFMNDWNTTLKNMNRASSRDVAIDKFNEIKERIAIVDEMIQKENPSWQHSIWNGLVTGSEGSYTSGTLYRVSNSNNRTVDTGAPWGSQHEEIIKRIKADMTGADKDKYTRNGITYVGKNLNQYKGKTFKEKFIEIQTSGTTITDTDEEDNIEYSLETVKGNKKLEIVYIMQD